MVKKSKTPTRRKAAAAPAPKRRKTAQRRTPIYYVPQSWEREPDAPNIRANPAPAPAPKTTADGTIIAKISEIEARVAGVSASTRIIAETLLGSGEIGSDAVLDTPPSSVYYRLEGLIDDLETIQSRLTTIESRLGTI